MIVTWGSCIAYVYDNKLIKERRAECVCVHAWTGNNTVMNSNVAFHVRYFTLLLYCASFVRRKSLSQFRTRVNKREDTCTSGRLAVDQSNYTLGVTLLDTVRPLCLPHKLLSPTKSFSCRAPVFFFFLSVGNSTTKVGVFILCRPGNWRFGRETRGGLGVLRDEWVTRWG